MGNSGLKIYDGPYEANNTLRLPSQENKLHFIFHLLFFPTDNNWKLLMDLHSSSSGSRMTLFYKYKTPSQIDFRLNIVRKKSGLETKTITLNYNNIYITPHKFNSIELFVVANHQLYNADLDDFVPTDYILYINGRRSKTMRNKIPPTYVSFSEKYRINYNECSTYNDCSLFWSDTLNYDGFVGIVKKFSYRRLKKAAGMSTEKVPYEILSYRARPPNGLIRYGDVADFAYNTFEYLYDITESGAQHSGFNMTNIEIYPSKNGVKNRVSNMEVKDTSQYNICDDMYYTYSDTNDMSLYITKNTGYNDTSISDISSISSSDKKDTKLYGYFVFKNITSINPFIIPVYLYKCIETNTYFPCTQKLINEMNSDSASGIKYSKCPGQNTPPEDTNTSQIVPVDIDNPLYNIISEELLDFYIKYLYLYCK